MADTAVVKVTVELEFVVRGAVEKIDVAALDVAGGLTLRQRGRELADCLDPVVVGVPAMVVIGK